MNEKRLKEIENAVNIQCSEGNWNYDPYMFGMANGMILVQAMINGDSPVYLNRPVEWLCESSGCVTVKRRIYSSPY